MTATLQNQQTELIKALNRHQANALIAFLNYKKYHWLTHGPLFQSLHLLFDKHSQEVFATLDVLAERSLHLDGSPVADPAEYLSTATVKPSKGDLSVREFVEEAIAAHERIIAEMHQDAELASEAGDIGTADIYTRLVQIHQKQRWFLKELLQKSDGLVS